MKQLIGILLQMAVGFALCLMSPAILFLVALLVPVVLVLGGIFKVLAGTGRGQGATDGHKAMQSRVLRSPGSPRIPSPLI